MHRINIIFRGLELYLKTDNQSQFTFYILQPFLFMNIMLMQFSSRFSVGREAQTSETFMSDVQQQHFNARIDLLHCFSHCTEHCCLPVRPLGSGFVWCQNILDTQTRVQTVPECSCFTVQPEYENETKRKIMNKID